MKYQIMTIRDNVTEVFNKPYYSLNNADGIRAFVNSLRGNPNKNDYTLYRCGEFDEENGVHYLEDTPVKIYTGLDIKDEE
jgi:hypothetical protein